MLAGVLSNSDTIVFEYAFLNVKKHSIDVQKIGCVFADELEFLFDDVYHELIFPLENLHYSVEDIQKIVKSLVRYFGVSYLLDKKISDLTEEEKGLLRILLAIIHAPKLLIIDDPFSMMHHSFRKNVIKKLFSYLEKNHITLIFSSSSLEDILMSEYTYVLQNGEIAMEGKTLSILKEDTRLKKLGFELPFMVDLSLKLKYYDLIDHIELDMDRLVNALWK